MLLVKYRKFGRWLHLRKIGRWLHLSKFGRWLNLRKFGRWLNLRKFRRWLNLRKFDSSHWKDMKPYFGAAHLVAKLIGLDSFLNFFFNTQNHKC